MLTKGGAFYNVTATFDASGSVASSLAMPETSGADALTDSSLNLTDSLSFSQLNADALADISSTSLAELDEKPSWQNLASLA